MKIFCRVALVLALLVTSAPVASAQTAPQGRVTGRVLDAVNASPLPGVTVEVVGSPLSTVTDLDGKYTLQMARGKHQVRVALSGFAERVFTVDLSVMNAQVLDVTLAIASFSEQVNVTGQITEATSSTAASQLLERRRATTINDNMGSQEMRANADGNAAAALQRVTGLSVVDNQYVYVRGLGERYSNTSLSGAILPSTDPDRKVVSLDMFPSSLLDSVQVVKTFTPDRSAEFAGGLVELNMAKLPSRTTLDASYSFGGNTQSFGKSILDHASGDRDWLGLSNSARQLPSAFPNKRVIRGGIYTPDIGVLQDELERLGEMLPNVWTPSTVDGRANQGFSLALGTRMGRLGVSASLTHGYAQDYQEEDLVYFANVEGGSDTLEPFSDYRYKVGTTRATMSGLLNLAYQFTGNHRLGFQGFTTDKGKRETRTFEGFNDDASRNFRNSRLLWQEESLRTGQVTGEHYFPTASNSRVDWRMTIARSHRDEPDVRETLYEEVSFNSGRFTLADESQSGLRLWNDLTEDAVDVAVNWSLPFSGPRALPALVKFGPSYNNRTRDFSSRRFRFVPTPGAPGTAPFDFTQRPEDIFSAANIGDRFELREETRNTDFYEAEQRVVGGYGMIDLSLSTRARMIAGVRLENYRQTVDTFDLFDFDFDGEIQVIRGENKSTDIFPALNFVYALSPSQNLRVSASQTVNRPEFRELAPFEFTDIVGGRAVVGNPDLERSLIQNYDVRWEWFGGPEDVVSAGVFLKRFDQPVERIIQATSQLRTSFDNAKSARNTGFELEARRRFSEYVLVGANYTFIDSAISLNARQTNVLTSLDRPLVGTSKHIFNAMGELRLPVVTARLLFNSFSDRIGDVGSFGLPDIFEEGRQTVDFALSTTVRNLRLRFSAENLTDPEYRWVQGAGNVHRSFTIGRTYMFQVGFSAF